MTAEALVMNKNGVAIAADSVVAISATTTPKMFNTINKLFRLSTNAPVAIMIYGGAEFMGLPWETLIDDYRSKLGSATFPEIDTYAANFLQYLAELRVDEKERRDIVLDGLGAHFCDLFETISTSLAQATELRGRDELPLDKFVSDQLDRAEVGLNNLTNLLPSPFIPRSKFISSYRDEIVHAWRDWASALPISLSSHAHKTLDRLAYLFVVKDVFSSASSGFVIAGFGDNQLLPGVRAYRIEAALPNTLKYKIETKRDITRSNQGIIIPFAQTEVVYRFLQGVDREYEDYVFALFSELASEIAKYAVQNYASQKHKSAAYADVQAIVRDKVASISKDAASYRNRYFVTPVLEAVKNLPKQDLAALAEALVQLTSLRRKMSIDLETVREPIDVAVVSKSDGFVWIKRKLYYDPLLNPQLASVPSQSRPR